MFKVFVGRDRGRGFNFVATYLDDGVSWADFLISLDLQGAEADAIYWTAQDTSRSAFIGTGVEQQGNAIYEHVPQGAVGPTLEDGNVILLNPVVLPESLRVRSVNGQTGNVHDIAAASLKTATGSVDVAAATAPSTGQVLTAVDSTHATWQSPAGGGAASGLASQDGVVNVSNSSGPLAGQILTAVDGTHAEWQDAPAGGGGGAAVAAKRLSTNLGSSTTPYDYQQVSDLQIPFVGGKTYAFDALLVCVSISGSGISAGINGSWVDGAPSDVISETLLYKRSLGGGFTTFDKGYIDTSDEGSNWPGQQTLDVGTPTGNQLVSYRIHGSFTANSDGYLVPWFSITTGSDQGFMRRGSFVSLTELITA